MKLFISYSRDDSAWVHDLANQLKDAPEYQVWIDRRLVGADLWWDTILDEIEDADCVIVILSPKAVDSIFCQAEFYYALALNKPVLSLLLKPCAVPDELLTRGSQQEDLTNSHSLDKAVVTCERALNRIERRLLHGEFAAPTPAPKRPPEPEANKAEHGFELFQAMDEAIQAGNLAIAARLCRQIEQVEAHTLGPAAKERLAVAQDEQDRARAAWRAIAGRHGAEHDANGDTPQPNTPAEKAPAVPQLTAQELVKRGDIRAHEGDTDSALADFSEAIALDPKYAAAYYNRGVLRSAKGDMDGALADFSETIRLDPKYARAYYRRGMLRAHIGDHDGALADFSEAIALDPKYARAYNHRGNARKNKGDLDGAIADFSEAIALDPTLATAYNNRASARKAKGDADGAIADYTRAIGLDPKRATAYSNRGNARKDKGDTDGAIVDYTRAIGLNPKSAYTYCYRGNARRAKGDKDGAIADYSAAIGLNPKFAYAYSYRAYLRADKGDFKGAAEDALKFLEIAPDDSLAPIVRTSLKEWQRKG